MKTPRNLLAVAIIVLTTAALSCNKKSDSSNTGTGAYFPKVRTIIQNNCASCHLSTGTWAGRPTALDNDSEIIAAAASIKAAVADPATPLNRRMPEGSSLSTADVNTIVSWYNKGGKITD